MVINFYGKRKMYVKDKLKNDVLSDNNVTCYNVKMLQF